jgi:sec-independent protein translocase protein TatB
MFGLGTSEMVLIAVVALVVIGPERLPRIMRQLGRYYAQIRRAADDLRRAFVMEADRQDAQERYEALQARRRQELEARKAAEAAARPADAAPPADAPTVEAPTAAPEAPEAPAALVPNDLPPDAPHPHLLRKAE